MGPPRGTKYSVVRRFFCFKARDMNRMNIVWSPCKSLFCGYLVLGLLMVVCTDIVTFSANGATQDTRSRDGKLT